jgi:16S rRNA (guanine527-N7)-methyltransferase
MDQLVQFAKQIIGVEISAPQAAAFGLFERELIAWNERFNLTAISDPEGIRIKHFLDSLTCIPLMFEKRQGSKGYPGRLVDVGTGAGFPGIPLKIVLPNLHVTLVESTGKKVDFCRHIIQSLELKDIQAVQARAEDMGQMPEHREQYDWAVARAVAGLPALVEYLLPLVKVGGVVLALKGAGGPAEAAAAEHALRLIGGRIRHLRQVTLPGVVEERYIIVIDKVAVTPDKYPRRVGVPTKKPL